MNIGEKIKELRIEKGMTLEQVGNLVGVGKSTVRKWEVGMIENMRRDKIEKLATALGVSPDFFFEDASLKSASAASSVTPSLSSSENRLLSIFRKLDAADQDEVIRFVDFKAAAPKYAEERKERLA